MAPSVGFCSEQHPVIAYFGWECPLCAQRQQKFIATELRQYSANDLRRAVVRDFNRLFYVQGEGV